MISNFFICFCNLNYLWDRSPQFNRQSWIGVTRGSLISCPSSGSLSDATFTDNFNLSLSNPQRGIVQQDIRQNNTLAGQNIFQVRQDVVVLLKNGSTEYDVRVARNQVLEIKGPAAPASTAAPFGGLGFRLQLGSGGGRTPSTGRPDRVASTHNP